MNWRSSWTQKKLKEKLHCIIGEQEFGKSSFWIQVSSTCWGKNRQNFFQRKIVSILNPAKTVKTAHFEDLLKRQLNIWTLRRTFKMNLSYALSLLFSISFNSNTKIMNTIPVSYMQRVSHNISSFCLKCSKASKHQNVHLVKTSKKIQLL